jgi:hypothetical protein
LCSYLNGSKRGISKLCKKHIAASLHLHDSFDSPLAFSTVSAADVNARHHGRETPLDESVERGETENVIVLWKHGGKINDAVRTPGWVQGHSPGELIPNPIGQSGLIPLTKTWPWMSTPQRDSEDRHLFVQSRSARDTIEDICLGIQHRETLVQPLKSISQVCAAKQDLNSGLPEPGRETCAHLAKV